MRDSRFFWNHKNLSKFDKFLLTNDVLCAMLYVETKFWEVIMKHRTRLTLLLSRVCCALSLVAAVAFAIAIPYVIPWYLSEHEPVLLDHLPLILVCLYVGVAIAVTAIVLLFFLLHIIHKRTVFSPVSAKLVSAIAWLVMLEGCVFGVLATAYLPAIGILLVAVTLGLCLLVISGVLKEATAIKVENDQTI